MPSVGAQSPDLEVRELSVVPLLALVLGALFGRAPSTKPTITFVKQPDAPGPEFHGPYVGGRTQGALKAQIALRGHAVEQNGAGLLFRADEIAAPALLRINTKLADAVNSELRTGGGADLLGTPGLGGAGRCDFGLLNSPPVVGAAAASASAW